LLPPVESKVVSGRTELAVSAQSNRACGFRFIGTQSVVLVGPPAFRDNRPMGLELPEDYYEPSPAPWAFETHRYGLANVLLDRDGRVIASHFPISNGPLLEQAPANRGRAPHSAPLEFGGFDSKFTLEPRGD
jgi:hypothetical protein